MLTCQLFATANALHAANTLLASDDIKYCLLRTLSPSM
jgi:hypothetical protein